MTEVQRRILQYLADHPELHLHPEPFGPGTGVAWEHNDVQAVPAIHREGPACSLRVFQSLYEQAWIVNTANIAPLLYGLSHKGQRALEEVAA